MRVCVWNTKNERQDGGLGQVKRETRRKQMWMIFKWDEEDQLPYFLVHVQLIMSGQKQHSIKLQSHIGNYNERAYDGK